MHIRKTPLLMAVAGVALSLILAVTLPAETPRPVAASAIHSPLEGMSSIGDRSASRQSAAALHLPIVFHAGQALPLGGDLMPL